MKSDRRGLSLVRINVLLSNGFEFRLNAAIKERSRPYVGGFHITHLNRPTALSNRGSKLGRYHLGDRHRKKVPLLGEYRRGVQDVECELGVYT